MRWPFATRTQPMSRSFEGTFPHDYPPGSGGVCRIRVFSASDRPTVVIATELPDSPGKTITWGAEWLAWDVCQRFGIDPERLRSVEHKPAAGRFAEYAWVEFGRPVNGEFVGYMWQLTTRARVERVIGQKLTV